ncbi:MAG: MFS transporter [Firmicutes bacterium]|nr:MFS transporter [Bacillota bacterium]
MIMDYTNKLRKNVNKNYIFYFLKTLDLTQGIWMLYLAMKGMSLVQLGLLEGVFHVTSFLMEVPTGAIADIYGRKTSRILGRFCSVISVCILLLSNDFYLFALSFVFTAISFNLESGAGEALVYDSLKEIKEEEKYMKITGRQEVFYQIAKVIAFILGGYLATRSYKLAFVITITIGIITIIQAFSFTEPKIGKNERVVKNPFKVIKKQVTEGINVIKNNKKVGFFIIFSELLSTLVMTVFYYHQNFLKGNGFNEAQIGIVYAASALLTAILASQVYKIERKIKEKGILLIVPIITVTCLWGLSFSNYQYIFFILMMGTEGIIFVAINDYLNKLIPSYNRATVLSFSSMVFSLFMIVLFPIIGKIGDLYSLDISFIFLAIVGSILVIINTFYVLKMTKKETLKQES